MAVITKFVDLTENSECLKFCQSNAEERSYAKSFWNSLHLHPPIESCLVSNNNKQRLKCAAPPSQAPLRVNVMYPKHEISQEDKEFQLRAIDQTIAQETIRKNEIAKARSEDLQRLQKQRDIRIKKEQYALSVRQDTTTDIPEVSISETDIQDVLNLQTPRPGRLYTLGISKGDKTST